MNPSLQVLEGECNLLNRFYVDTRYPVHWPTKYSKEEALKAMVATQRIHDVIKETLKEVSERELQPKV